MPASRKKEKEENEEDEAKDGMAVLLPHQRTKVEFLLYKWRQGAAVKRLE